MHTTPTTIIVFGALGRLGSRVCALAQRDASYSLAGAIVRRGSPALGRAVSRESDAKHTLKYASIDDAPREPRPDVVIDFSSSQGAQDAIAFALDARAALLVGTTALSTIVLDELREASKKISVLVAPNTSLGVAVLARAAAQVARELGPAYDISIVEAHHNQKKDAPSGTALRLARAISAAGREVREDQIVAVRGGDVVGEHTIRFAGPGEYLELTHRATTRDVFAHGALRAASWLAGRSAGWYTMEDVLGVS